MVRLSGNVPDSLHVEWQSHSRCEADSLRAKGKAQRNLLHVVSQAHICHVHSFNDAAEIVEAQVHDVEAIVCFRAGKKA